MPAPLDASDEVLRRRLIRSTAGEFLVCLLLSCAVLYLFLPLLASTLRHGSISLHVGRFGHKRPVVLSLAEFPWALIGTLVVGAGIALMPISRLVSSAYHLVRHTFPGLALSRTPKSKAGRALAWVAFPGAIFLVALGGALSITQLAISVLR